MRSRGIQGGPRGIQVDRERPDLVLAVPSAMKASRGPRQETHLARFVFKKSLWLLFGKRLWGGEQAGSVVRGQRRPRWRPVGL